MVSTGIFIDFNWFKKPLKSAFVSEIQNHKKMTTNIRIAFMVGVAYRVPRTAYQVCSSNLAIFIDFLKLKLQYNYTFYDKIIK